MPDGTFHTVAELQSKFKTITFGTTGRVTTAEVEAEIARTENYIEGKVDPFYVFSDITAVGQPKTFSIIKTICLYRTLAVINEILRKNGVEQQNPEEKLRIINEYANSEKMLRGIALYATVGNVEGALKLPDGTLRALPTGNPAGLTSSQTKPVFKKDIAQW